MPSTENKFHDQIQVEKLWVVTEQGKYIFLSMLVVSSVLVFGLWKMAPHHKLLSWFALLTAVNFGKWRILNFYFTHKQALIANISRFKLIVLCLALLTGMSWGLCIVWFLIPEQPINVLAISLAVCFEIFGAMLTWTCYLPAVIAITLPSALPLIAMVFAQNSHESIAASSLISLMTLLSVPSSFKLAGVLNQALVINFENVYLRQESEEKSLLLETALENMSQGICMSDSDDRLRMWNSRFSRMMGETANRIERDAKLSTVLEAGYPPIPISSLGKLEYQSSNGQIYEIHQMNLAQGGRVITYTDISDLINRAKALDRAKKEAEQAHAANTRFLASASHDLRQPIHALGLFFAELSDRVYSQDTAPLIGQIEVSMSAVNDMLNALLDISKLDAGVVAPSIQTVELASLFSHLEEEFKPIAQENGNKLHIRPTHQIVKTDPGMLERILRNLISNALRYTENGQVLVAARPRGINTEIQVWDNGCGIPEDQFKEIFVEFHQLQNPARNRKQGLGLGLAIVKRLADLLQHEVKLRSTLKHGSCFSIILPLCLQLPNIQFSPIKEKWASNYASLIELKIMVLDDDNAILEGMYGLLSRWGCLVITANSPDELIVKLSAADFKVDLLITDYRLPHNISGIDVARNLQSHLGYPFAVLIITGDTGPERLREAELTGYPLLHKPVQPAKLRSTLHYLRNKLNS